MLSREHQQLVQALQRWADIPLVQQQAIAEIFRPLTVEREAILLHAGEYPRTLAFIASGLLRLYYIDAKGNEFIKSFCVENEIVSAYSALLLNEPSRLFIQALEPSKLLVAEYLAYQRVSAQHPCWQIVNSRIAETLFIKKEKREAALLLNDAELFLPSLLRHEEAAIVNVTSGLAYVPKQSAPVYCASKAGLHMFTKALRWQLEASHVRVFELIAPLTDTPMTAGRGRSKSTPTAVAAEFWEDFLRDLAVMPIGRSKALLRLQRIMPALADRIMRPGL